jgi:ADP-ribose pyrophosphatase YjhB (NUDIX family)
MSTEDRSYIRTKAMAVLLSADRTQHAVIRFAGTPTDPEPFHRLVGGGVELGERSVEAVVREIGEELGTTLHDPRLLGVLENIFDYEGEPGHEVVFVYSGVLAEPVIPPGGGWFQDNGDPMFVQWRPVDELAHEWPLYPSGSGALVRALAASVVHIASQTDNAAPAL